MCPAFRFSQGAFAENCRQKFFLAYHQLVVAVTISVKGNRRILFWNTSKKEAKNLSYVAPYIHLNFCPPQYQTPHAVLGSPFQQWGSGVYMWTLSHNIFQYFSIRLLYGYSNGLQFFNGIFFRCKCITSTLRRTWQNFPFRGFLMTWSLKSIFVSRVSRTSQKYSPILLV